MLQAQPVNPRDQLARRRDANVMLSRVAASLYWMSRYLERAENLSRLVDVNLQLLLDFGSIDDQATKEHWLPIVRSAGEEATFFEHYDKADSQNVTDFMTFQAANPNSVFSCVSAARENARQVRDQISLEMWEVLNECYLFLCSKDAREVWNEGASAFYEQIKRLSHLFQGLTDSTYTRNEGWEFIQLGKYIERADKVTRILDVKYHMLLPNPTDVGGAVDTAQWQAVLRSASALQAYRRFYVAEILPWKVAEFLIFSDTFPRSIRYCLDRVDDSLRRISAAAPATPVTPAEQSLARLRGDLARQTVDDVFKTGLHEHMAETQRVIDAIGAHIFDAFMYHPPIDMAAEIRLHQQEQQQQQQQQQPAGRDTA